jgi:hypothetical protein
LRPPFRVFARLFREYGSQAINGRPLERRPERLGSIRLRVRKLPESIFYYRKSELIHNGIKLTLPRVEYGDGFLSREDQQIKSASRALQENVLGDGWAELGISAIEMRKKFQLLR